MKLPEIYKKYQNMMKQHNKSLENGDIKCTDYLCPMLKALCVGIDCAFYLDDANHESHLGDHPCSINVIASHFLYEKWKEDLE